jgi:hypothetical protein
MQHGFTDTGVEYWTLDDGITLYTANTNIGWKGVWADDSSYGAYLTKSEAGDQALVTEVRPGSNTAFDLGSFDDPRKSCYAAAYYRIHKDTLLPQYAQWKRQNPNMSEPLFDAYAIMGGVVPFPAELMELPLDPMKEQNNRLAKNIAEREEAKRQENVARMEERQRANAIEDQFANLLRNDPTWRQVFASINATDKVDAHEEALDVLKSGGTEAEALDMLKQYQALAA